MKVIVTKNKIILLATCIVAVIIIAKLFYIQVLDDEYEQIAKRNALYYQTQYPARGLIYDRNNNILVSNQTMYDVAVIPREINDFDTLELCKTLNVSKEVLSQSLTDLKIKNKNKGIASYQQTPIVKHISIEAYTRFQEKKSFYNFSGFYTRTYTARKYTINSAANLLGYITEVDKSDIKNDSYYQQGDIIGKNGIEARYEKELRGRKGVAIYTRDVRNQIQDHYKNGEEDSMAVTGLDLTCTIDSVLQNYGEKLMQNKMGSIVAIEPSTGEILLLVSSPCFNPSLLDEENRATNYKKLVADKYKPLFNRAIMSPCPPGSVFKVANALIGLQENVLTPDTYYPCAMGYHVGLDVGCHAHPSPINMTKSLLMSCNSYYCYVLRTIIDNPKYENIYDAFDNWKEYCLSFGFGRKLDSDLYGEKIGSMPTTKTYDNLHGRNRWKSLSIISLAIGQGEIGCTQLQIANFMATIANRGYYYVPHVVKDIAGNGIDKSFTVKHYTKVDTTNYKKVIEGMYLAVNGFGMGNTAGSAYVAGLDICGKTGTAQNPHGENHSAFACFAPRENPKIAVAVYVENAGYGATWAAPIASLIIEKYLTGTTTRPYLEEKMINANFLNKVKINE
ncbi:MAG: penicillin-binding protein 2 [Prevotellaceae bacterium]|jgi:penicillin-binding protein 2|nr:penicillin-binding protein 2 [Prevotellaceae bacterium]